jgi:hypothetical protein
VTAEELAEPTPEIADVLKANERFYEAIENADLDLMRAVWVSPAEGVAAHCVHPGQNAVHGVSQILRSWAVVLSRMTYLQFFLTDVRVAMIGAVAIVTCVENVLSDLPGEQSASAGFGGSHYEAVNVFRLEAGEWRLITHSSATVFPTGSSSPAADE